jgi:hypothetical protein
MLGENPGHCHSWKDTASLDAKLMGCVVGMELLLDTRKPAAVIEPMLRLSGANTTSWMTDS